MTASENGQPPSPLTCTFLPFTTQPAFLRHSEPADMIATMTETQLSTRITSPIGMLTLTSNGSALTQLVIARDAEITSDVAPAEVDAVLAAACEQLDAYFDMRLTAFDLPLEARGTDFQRRVWNSLKSIPYGETISYAELARRIEQPKAVRAVGAANGRNPLMIIVPCHRVIGADGSLTGFGGGIDRKRWLLDHETRARVR
jgi:methylated-DNA-[protein]-cysteine S-methyltransferase